MTREEQRKEASYEFATKFGGKDPTMMEIVALWFRRGAKWADEHPVDYGGKAMLHVLNKGVEQGKKEILNNLWKPADGDDLPEIDREVVVFVQNFPDDAGIMKVAIAHRPNPNGWDGRNILTGEVDHYTPKTYDNGGWNIPDVRWWLDLDLPNMED